MWSRYSRRLSQKPAESPGQQYRDLLGTHSQSLGFKRLDKVKVDCSFLPESKWGLLRDLPGEPPAWLLYLQLQFSQPENFKLESATVELTFEKPGAPDGQLASMAGLGPVLTEYYGPSSVSKGQLIGHKLPAALGSVGRDAANQQLLYAYTWPVDGDVSGLHRRIEWSITEPYPEQQLVLSRDKMRVGLVLTNDLDHFLIDVRIEGQLQGRHGWFRFPSSTASSSTSIRIRVFPPGKELPALDTIAKELDDDMTARLLSDTRGVHTPLNRPASEESPSSYGATRSPRMQSSISASPRQVTKQLPNKSTDYTIGWICALPVEMAAARAMLDRTHDWFTAPLEDQNNYILGSIGPHNVVVACLPAGVCGIYSAATVATQMVATFRSIRFSLLVGIGGGAPSKDADIRLGDVVVSKPTGTLGGVVQHDRGKTISNGMFEQTGALNKPPQALLTTIAKMQASNMVCGNRMADYMAEMLARYPNMHDFAFPGRQYDCLFRSNYGHVGSSSTCEQCDPAQRLDRWPRVEDTPRVHYGIIASGSQVMRDGRTRNRIARAQGVICFEMEAAGLMDSFPCLVIRGISDYADAHKNDIWHKYAAATAAAYAKEFLSMTPVRPVELTPSFQA